MGSIAREDADIVKGKFSWVIVRPSLKCHPFLPLPPVWYPGNQRFFRVTFQDLTETGNNAWKASGTQGRGYLFGAWAKRRMTFKSMLGPEGSIKNIQILQIHIVYEPIIKVPRTITHVMCDFFLYVN